MLKNWDCVLIIDLQNFYLCSGYRFSVRGMICKSHLSVCASSFHSLNAFGMLGLNLGFQLSLTSVLLLSCTPASFLLFLILRQGLTKFYKLPWNSFCNSVCPLTWNCPTSATQIVRIIGHSPGPT